MENTEMVNLAQKIMFLSRDRLLMNLRFLDVALSELKLQAVTGTDRVCCNSSVSTRKIPIV